jgi:hypothetical protein
MRFGIFALSALCCSLVFGSLGVANAAKLGELCGGIGSIQCNKGLWCDPDPGQCGGREGAGRCVKFPIPAVIAQSCISPFVDVTANHTTAIALDNMQRSAKEAMDVVAKQSSLSLADYPR